MSQEGIIMRGREPPLIFLWHPGTHDRFSGYGLRIAPAHLIGVVMIDRPRPAASTWLEGIQQTFGGYDLVTMARDGARGIVCPMRIVEESQVCLRVFRHPQREEIRKALQPLVAVPPAVTLAMAWDDSSGDWVSTIVRPPKFPLGQIIATPGALRALVEVGQNTMKSVRRHQSGDWGDLSEQDRQENELSLQQGFRLLSAYQTANGERIGVVTEADRSATTLLLPKEY